MPSTILITGGTGTVGRQVVPRLRDTHSQLRVLSRRQHRSEDGVDRLVGDLQTGAGIDAAVDGADTVLHLAGGPRGDEVATRNLVQAATRARVSHLVVISVIAADRVPLAYFRAKAAVEHVVATSNLPWTMLRTAQFHDLVLAVVGALARWPVIPTPCGIRAQPVDSGEVAARLAALSLADPAGWVPDLAGPHAEDFGALVRAYLRVRKRRRLLVPVRAAGPTGRAYRAGANLNLHSACRGTRTWDEFLDERFPE